MLDWMDRMVVWFVLAVVVIVWVTALTQSHAGTCITTRVGNAYYTHCF